MRRRHRAAPPGAAAGRAARAVHASRATSCAPATAAPRTSTSTRSTPPPATSPSPRTRPSSTAGPQAGVQGITEASPHAAIPRGENFDDYPRPVAKAVELLLRAGHRRPLRARARDRRLHGRHRDRRARRLPAVRPPAQDPRRPDRLVAGGATARSSLSLRGGDFLLESRPGPRGRLRPPRRRRRAPLPRGVLQLPRRHARGRRALSRAWVSPSAAAGRARPAHRPAHLDGQPRDIAGRAPASSAFRSSSF